MGEFALDTFTEVTVDADGKRLPAAQAIRNVVEEACSQIEWAATPSGLRAHRDDSAVSAPEVVLAAVAARAERIKLGTAVTVLTSDEPIRLLTGTFAKSCPVSRLFETRLNQRHQHAP